jgi:O-antigen/teichoic acid export membrane protein
MSLKALATSASWNALAGLCAQGAAFVSGIIVARLLGPEATGTASIVLWIAGTFVILTHLGIPAALNRFLPELRARGELRAAADLTSVLYKRTLVVQICVAVGVLAVVNCAGPRESWTGNFGRLFGDPRALAITCAFCLTLGLQTFLHAFWSGGHRFVLIARTAALSAGCQLLVLAVGAAHYGVYGALLGYVAGTVPAAVLSLQFLGRSNGHAEPALLRRSGAFALTMWLGGIISSIVWVRTELLFLGLYADLRDVGFFTVAHTLANLAAQLPFAISAVLFPYLAARRGSGPLADVFAKYAAALKLFAFLVFPASFGIAALAPALIPMLFGRAFAPAADTATILVVASGFAAAASIGSTLLYVADRSHVVLCTDVIGAVGFVVAGITLIPTFGIEGAAWTRAAVQASVIGAQTWYLHAVLGCRLPLRSLGLIVIAATISALIARLVLCVDNSLLGIVGAIAAGSLTYYGAVRRFSVLGRDDVDRLGTLCRVIPGRMGRWIITLAETLRTSPGLAK